MAKSKFRRICKFICISFFQIIWFLILLFFVILPRMIILSIRRVHIKNKTQRKLRKYGLPKKMAKIHAKNYKTMLVNYGSIRGLWRVNKAIRKERTDEETLTNNKIETKTIDQPDNHSFIG